jgi:hypothetical protein
MRVVAWCCAWRGRQSTRLCQVSTSTQHARGKGTGRTTSFLDFSTNAFNSFTSCMGEGRSGHVLHHSCCQRHSHGGLIENSTKAEHISSARLHQRKQQLPHVGAVPARGGTGAPTRHRCSHPIMRCMLPSAPCRDGSLARWTCLVMFAGRLVSACRQPQHDGVTSAHAMPVLPTQLAVRCCTATLARQVHFGRQT